MSSASSSMSHRGTDSRHPHPHPHPQDQHTHHVFGTTGRPSVPGQPSTAVARWRRRGCEGAAKASTTRQPGSTPAAPSLVLSTLPATGWHACARSTWRCRAVLTWLLAPAVGLGLTATVHLVSVTAGTSSCGQRQSAASTPGCLGLTQPPLQPGQLRGCESDLATRSSPSFNQRSCDTNSADTHMLRPGGSSQRCMCFKLSSSL
eukprot:1266328-Rhodomonas_salina.2